MTETIFAWPGLGRYAFQSVRTISMECRVAQILHVGRGVVPDYS